MYYITTKGHRGTHGSIKYDPNQVLFLTELRITDHNLRPLYESYLYQVINI